MNAQAQLHTFYVAHHLWLVNWLHRRLGCQDDASDLAQDTFLRVLSRPAQLDGLHRPRAWLAIIAHGLMVDHVRRRDLERAYLEALFYMAEHNVPSAEKRVVVLDILVRIDAMLYGLSPKVREAFLLSRLMGLNYMEIAQRLEVSLSSVEKYMAKAYRHCLAVRMAAS